MTLVSQFHFSSHKERLLLPSLVASLPFITRPGPGLRQQYILWSPLHPVLLNVVVPLLTHHRFPKSIDSSHQPILNPTLPCCCRSDFHRPPAHCWPLLESLRNFNNSRAGCSDFLRFTWTTSAPLHITCHPTLLDPWSRRCRGIALHSFIALRKITLATSSEQGCRPSSNQARTNSTAPGSSLVTPGRQGVQQLACHNNRHSNPTTSKCGDTALLYNRSKPPNHRTLSSPSISKSANQESTRTS